MDSTYDEADHLTALWYPGGSAGQQGEQVQRVYYPSTGQLNQVLSGATQLIASTTYNPQGQVVEQRYDQSPNGLTRQWVYETNTLRLSTLRAGTASPWTNLQQLTYTYDRDDNVKTLTDGVNSGQQQCFGYDWLDRLTSAFTGNSACSAYSGVGTGPYNASYRYDPLGNLTGVNNSSYRYSTPKVTTPVHGLKWIDLAPGGGTSQTVTVRAKGAAAAGVWPVMELWVNGVRQTSWSVTSTVYQDYTTAVVLSGRDQLEVVFTNDYYAGGEDRNLWVDYVQVGSQTVQAEGPAVLDRGNGDAAFDGHNVIAGQEGIYWNGALRFVVGGGQARGYDASGNLSYVLKPTAASVYSHDAENRLVQVKRNGAVIGSFVYDADGNRVKGTVNGVTTVYIAGLYEYQDGATTRYDTGQAGVVALRRSGYASGNGLVYRLDDHLGSTSVLVSPAGVVQTPRNYYSPYGNSRGGALNSLTRQRFTGQYHKDGLTGHPPYSRQRQAGDGRDQLRGARDGLGHGPTAGQTVLDQRAELL